MTDEQPNTEPATTDTSDDTDRPGAPTADEQPTTPAPEPAAATQTTDRTQTTIEPADQQP